jgi:long-chain acyl-CoA synthetase
VTKQNLARLADAELARNGDYDSLFFEGDWLRSGDLADRASRFACGLIGLGLRPGDRVVVMMANCPEVLIGYSALWRAGGVVTPVLFLVTEDELRHVLSSSEAVGVITTPEFLPKVRASAADVPGVRFIIVAGVASPDAGARGVAPGQNSPEELGFAEVSGAAPGTIVDRADDDLAALLYTGGTTGQAKGVPLSHANLYWCGQAAQRIPIDEDLSPALLPLPLAHAYGLVVACAGSHQPRPHRTILMRWFDPAGWVEHAARHRVGRTALVPSMIQMLLDQPLESSDLSSLIAVTSGAAPLAAQVRREFEARVPSAIIYEAYGCSESAGVISSNLAGRRRAGSVGLAADGCEITIRDNQEQPLPVGQDGEICVRSPGIMAGYWHSPEENASALAAGWFHTGDIGHLDEEGYLYVVDRKKDLIIRGGFNVYPRDVEDVLLAHPAVAMAAVVGRPDTRLGEEVVAFVSLRPGSTATEEELTAHVKARLAAHKYPREVHILNQVPLTSVGKLDRKQLRAQLRTEAIDTFEDATQTITVGQRPM